MTRRWADLFGSAPVVVDGGMSTQLEHQGNDISGLLWTGRVLLENPDAITRAHAAYIDAGADVVITSSYQVSRWGFEQAGLTAADADAALRASTAAARAAADASGRSVLVAASVGPYGAVLHDGSEYRGRYGRSHRQLVDFHRERLAVIADTAPDLLAVETIPDIDEAAALAEALGEYPDLPAWVTFSAAGRGTTCAGQRIEEAAAVVASMPSAIAVGVNCTDPLLVEDLIQRMTSSCALPVVVYPNAGGVWDAASGTWRDGSGAVLDGAIPDALVTSWLGAGASAIGGCCGTDAESIRRIASRMARPAG